jgi:energy-coupling factor transporter ATP-binding protein EcfA2
MLVQSLFLILLFAFPTAHCMDNEPFDDSYLQTIPAKPDLMPQEGKELITQLNSASQIDDQPHYIFFVGPKGCGKSTLINQFTESIGADPVGISATHVIKHCENNGYNSAAEIQKYVFDTIFKRACRQALHQQCPYAVVVVDNFDNYYEEQSTHKLHLIDVLFNSRFNRPKPHMIIIAETQAITSDTEIAHIPIAYPTNIQRMQLARYFLSKFIIDANEAELNHIVQKTENQPINEIRILARNCALHYACEAEKKRLRSDQTAAQADDTPLSSASGCAGRKCIIL